MRRQKARLTWRPGMDAGMLDGGGDNWDGDGDWDAGSAGQPRERRRRIVMSTAHSGAAPAGAPAGVGRGGRVDASGERWDGSPSQARAKSTYVMSDVHGCYDQFIEILSRISPGDDDEVWLLGDLFDRGPKSAEMADWLVNDRPDNFHLLMGNHERMMLDDVTDIHTMSVSDWSDWAYNGGRQTAQQLMRLDLPTRMELFEIVRSEDLCDIIPYVDETGAEPVEREIALVHAGFFLSRQIVEQAGSIDDVVAQQGRLDMIWERDTWLLSGWEPPIEVVFGHTPTPLIARMMRARDVSSHKMPYSSMGLGDSFPGEDQCVRGDERKIMQWGNRIAIDCGCAYGGRLACVRLEDKSVFYADSPEMARSAIALS